MVVEDLFERLVRNAIERTGWTRERAEAAARHLMQRAKPRPTHGRVVARDATGKVQPTFSKPARTKLKRKGKRARLKARLQAAATPDATVPKIASKPAKQQKKAKVPKKPLTPLQRLNRRIGPDDGKRRGGSPFVQGGSPGLGRRS